MDDFYWLGGADSWSTLVIITHISCFQCKIMPSLVLLTRTSCLFSLPKLNRLSWTNLTRGRSLQTPMKKSELKFRYETIMLDNEWPTDEEKKKANKEEKKMNYMKLWPLLSSRSFILVKNNVSSCAPAFYVEIYSLFFFFFSSFIFTFIQAVHWINSISFQL